MAVMFATPSSSRSRDTLDCVAGTPVRSSKARKSSCVPMGLARIKLKIFLLPLSLIHKLLMQCSSINTA